MVNHLKLFFLATKSTYSAHLILLSSGQMRPAKLITKDEVWSILSDRFVAVIVSAMVSCVIGVIQVVVVTIVARRTAREVSEDLILKEIDK